jgi:hypothetical protein
MNYKYQVALSFAGEDRVFAETVAEGLRAKGIDVFYDEFYPEKLWGEELPVKLGEIYSDASQYCIMILTKHYLEKMWTNVERQHAIQRQIKQKGQAYILPIRLDGFAGDVPGLPSTIGYLSFRSNQPGNVVDAFLKKNGLPIASEAHTKKSQPPSYIPKIKKTFTDKEKNLFLRTAFEEIVSLLDQFATDTHTRYPHIEHEMEKITSRKTLFTIYNQGKQITQFKVWIGGLTGGDSISILHGNRMDIENDNSMNESLSLEEHDGELRLKPMGMWMYGNERDKQMTPMEAAEYIWKMVCQNFS